MKIVKFETWWLKRDKCLFDEKRKGKSSMDWDVVVLKLTTDNGIEGVATALAARSGKVTEAYLQDNIAPVVLGRSPYEREAIWQDCGILTDTSPFSPCFCRDQWMLRCGIFAQRQPNYHYISILGLTGISCRSMQAAYFTRKHKIMWMRPYTIVREVFVHTRRIRRAPAGRI